MEPAYWRARWNRDQIEFHEPKPNHLLKKYGHIFGTGRRILVPMCGKSTDLDWLAEQGHEVVGVELSERGVHAFFDERGLAPAIDFVEPFTRYRHENIEILHGDFFDLTREAVGAVDTFYDRAAIVIFPEDDRARYVAHLRSLLTKPFLALLLLVENLSRERPAPPHVVPEAELRRLFGDARVERLPGPDDEERGASDVFTETCWSIASDRRSP